MDPTTLTQDPKIDRLVQKALRELDRAIDGYGPIARVYAMFSGGYDSLASTSVVAQHPSFSGVVHINTGIGVEETREFVRDTCAREGWPLIEKMPPDKSYEELILEHGFPGPGAHGVMYNYLKERAIRDVVYEAIAEEGDTGKSVLLATGVRIHESKRRMRNIQKVVQRNGNQIWVAPIHQWTGIDTHRYVELKGYPTNMVSDLLHMSGECLCGSFATKDEMSELELWFPETAAQIHALEEKAKEAGVIHDKWGWGNGFKEVPEDLGPLCSNCEMKGAEEPCPY